MVRQYIIVWLRTSTKIPLDFYYNKESGNIVYGNLMTFHYKQNPPHEKYFHISNFLQDLYALYQSTCKGTPQTQEDIALCSAIITFLTKIYPSQQLFNEKEAYATQHAFILPSHEHTDRDFVDTFLRPLLRSTPWLKSNDLASKTVFYSSIDTLGYLLNGSLLQWITLKLQREKKYLLCKLQKVNGQHKLLLTIDITRAVYDPDQIAASGNSIAALEGRTLFTLKPIAPPLKLEIAIFPTIEKMNHLAKFLYMKVFADEDDDSVEQLEDYNTNSRNRSLIHRLIRSISMSNYKTEWSRSIEAGHFPDHREWCHMLSDKNKARLSQITYMDILQLFDDFNISSLESEVTQYLRLHREGESFESLVAVDDKQEMSEVSYHTSKHHNSVNFDFTSQYCHQFYLLKAQHNVFSFVKNLYGNSNTSIIPITEWSLAEACAYKIWKMVSLSNKLGKPVVMKLTHEDTQENQENRLKEKAIHIGKWALVDKIKANEYFVEVKFSCSNEIKMYLNQVIETETDDIKQLRSTLSIQDLSYKVEDMYDYISGNIWNVIDQHSTNSECRSANEGNPDINRYTEFRSSFRKTIINVMESGLNTITDLDEVTHHYNAKPKCTCIIITHRLLMDAGLIPYLKYLGRAIVAPLRTNAMLGNYKISCLLLTGDFLNKWLERGSSTYGDFIWHHLQQAISTELNEKQLRTHLLMKESIVSKDRTLDYEPLKSKRYRQVFSKQYYLRISPNDGKNLQVYQDKGDHCLKIPATKQDGDLIWEIPLLPTEDKVIENCSLEERFYLIIDPKDTDRLYCEIRLIALSANDFENVDEALSSRMNVALMSDILPFESSAVDNLKATSTYPLEVKIMPCSYLSAIDLRMRMGIDASANDPLEYNYIAYSERLTLQQM
ncbi:hypothetical protein PS15m_008664 [Mucor circinelloides]